MINCCVQLKVLLKFLQYLPISFTIKYIVCNKYFTFFSFSTDRNWSMNELLTIKKIKSLNLTYVDRDFFLQTLQISISAISYICYRISTCTQQQSGPEFYFSCLSNLLFYKFIEKKTNSIALFLENKKSNVIFLIVFDYIFIMHFDFFYKLAKKFEQGISPFGQKKAP